METIPAPLPAPARVGDHIASVDTPALLLDLDAFEYNLRKLPETLKGRPIAIRPHAKAHKCPEIALRQIALGAVGACVQKVSEAEALVDGGVEDVLVVNEVVGATKLTRLARLATRARIGVCVDDRGNVGDIQAAAKVEGADLDVYVEVNVGGNRCGVEPGPDAVELAQAIEGAAHLRFAGIHAYHGSAQHVRHFDERRAAIEAAAAKVKIVLPLLEAAGLPAEVVTGAGTGSYLFESESGVYTEIQPGSYVFMDADYARNLDRDGQPTRVFQQSLFILATVMSHVHPGRAVVDAGLKAHSIDSGMPLVADVPHARYTRASDEHGVIEFDAPPTVKLGDKIRLIPGHCDPTVNLYDWFVCYRGERVEALWRITGRGAFY
ncbi:MAG TPA: DSD1 family PLP-dependent enzyme [Vicinamibacterales bacterium]